MNSVRIFKIVAFLIGLGAVFSAGSIFSVGIYEKCLQDQFNFTRFQSDIIVTLGYIGFTISLPSSFIRMKFGSPWLCATGFVLTVVGYLLFYAAFLNKTYPFLLMALYHFIIGHGSNYLYLASITVNLRNLPKNRCASVFGLFNSIFFVSPLILTLFYKLITRLEWFELHETCDSLRDYALSMAIICSLVGFLGVLLLHDYRNNGYHSGDESNNQLIYPDIRDYTSSAYEYGNNSERSSISEDNPQLPTVGFARTNSTVASFSAIAGPSGFELPPEPPIIENLYGRALLPRVDFHCLFWSFVMTMAVCFTLTTNSAKLLMKIAKISDDLDDSYDSSIDNCLAVLIVTQISAGIACGFFSDKFAELIPRCNLCVFSLIPCMISMLFCAVYPKNLTICVINLTVAAFTCGTFACIVPTLVREKFGPKYFTVNWTGVFTALGLLLIFLRIILNGFLEPDSVPPVIPYFPDFIRHLIGERLTYVYIIFSVFLALSAILLSIFISIDENRPGNRSA